MKKTIFKTLSLLFVCLLLFSLSLPAFAAKQSEMVEAPLSELDGVNTNRNGGGAVAGAYEDKNTPSPTPETNEDPTQGEVAGVTDEAPDGMQIFWGVVIALLIAAAVVFGIVMLVPKEGKEQ